MSNFILKLSRPFSVNKNIEIFFGLLYLEAQEDVGDHNGQQDPDEDDNAECKVVGQASAELVRNGVFVVDITEPI